MQLLIIVLAAFGLGFWFSRSRAADRLADSAQGLTNRLQRKSNPESEKVTGEGEESTGK